MAKLSVIVPVYNEVKTINAILDKINSVPIDKEIIVVDDGSSDGTDKILRSIRYENLKVIFHPSNRGKGAAFLTGLANASGEFVIIQDADLEYDPNDYIKLLEPLSQDKADIVLGARFKKGYQGLLMHRLGNRFLTFFLNLLFHSKLNDYLTCYKAAGRGTFKSFNLTAEKFDIEAQIVCSALKKKLRIAEIPVQYNPRSYRAGKKIRWNDGLQAIVSIIKYRFAK